MGSAEEPSNQQLALYVPNKDKDGREIEDIRTWIEEAQDVLTIIGRGSTTMPPADGTWLRRDVSSIEELEEDDVLRERTTLVCTYVDPDRFERNFATLREFLHRFGRETNQGEVVFEFDGEFLRVGKYDQDKASGKGK